jgi:hypothetical protein
MTLLGLVGALCMGGVWVWLCWMVAYDIANAKPNPPWKKTFVVFIMLNAAVAALVGLVLWMNSVKL